MKRSESKSQEIKLEISGKGDSARFELRQARTRSSYGKYDTVQPQLLIGLDNLRLGVPLKLREGGSNDPIAAKCRLGWTVYGSANNTSSVRAVVNFHSAAAADSDRLLNEQLRDFFTIDNDGIQNQHEGLESEDDKRARILLEKTTQRVGERFETGLLWRTDEPNFPDSYPMAVRRLLGLERKLAKDTSIADCVRDQIYDYERKGYAHKATQTELDSCDRSRMWFLPLGVVQHPRKQKVRLIWDARATVDGVSFNSKLLKGPDLLTSLVAVLSSFRQFPVAVCGDIREMFHQVQIREQDRLSQCFLWRDKPKDDIQVFVMDVATFGSTCSPVSAQFVKNLNAKQFADRYPRAYKAIVKHHYVDDFLGSFESTQEAVEVVEEVKYVHSKGGFDIRNFLSNSSEVMERIGVTPTNSMKKLALERGKNVESVLGMMWLPKVDCFTTRQLEAHVFVDASEAAYCCVVYFRLLGGNCIQVALVGAKSKVAPLKTLSIPRLELKAAVLGAQYLKTVLKNHEFPVSRTYMWTDSTTVLAWIFSDHRRFQKFVAVRVGEILTLSDPQDWRWINTKLNVADKATKWGNGPDFQQANPWFRGPAFLHQPEEHWPQRPQNITTQEEMRPVHVHWSPAPLIDVTRFNRLERMLRTIAYVLRFISNLRYKRSGKSLKISSLEQEELQKAEETLEKIT
ncbi:uncharacterized protein LOC134209791 [Armigeres subalbatus]|uniref:uncharacterized protein LOC134209791 n=1 Tax=Armigeres subalbatus TaxID=124917 RepID=UPI002ED52CFC